MWFLPCCISRNSAGTPDEPYKGKLILGRYSTTLSQSDVLGEGSFCVCYRAVDVVTNTQVAIKVYKKGGADADATLAKYKRQIEVLLELQKPFKAPSDGKLWHEHMETVSPCDLFVQLLDYSKSADGEPGPNPSDGELYVVTELAVESLKDYLSRRKHAKKPLPAEAVRSITKTLVFIVAGLHAKSLVHLDLKPENIMLVGENIKLIDVDGCFASGTLLDWRTLVASSVSFSLCYSAPEWARFLTKTSKDIRVMPHLDVWAIGMTICELITFNVVLKDQFEIFQEKGEQWAAWKIPRWLGRLDKSPVPLAIRDFDPQLYAMLSEYVVNPDLALRRTLAQCLGHPYLVPHVAVHRFSSVTVPGSHHEARVRQHSSRGSPRRSASFITASGDLHPYACGSEHPEDKDDQDGDHRLVAVLNAEDGFSGKLSAEPTNRYVRRSLSRSEEHPKDSDTEEEFVGDLPAMKKNKSITRKESTAAWAAAGQW